MSIGPSNFHWDTLLDDTQWDREESLAELLAVDQPSEPAHARIRLPLRRTLAAVAMSVLLACTVVLWLAARHGVAAIEAELHDVVAVENWAQRSDHITATASLVDPEADPAWQTGYLRELELASESAAVGPLQQTLMERTRLRSGLAMVQVTVTDQTGKAYRESRFYRETAAGWQRTSPVDVFWGREQVLETDHFRIRYRQVDAQAVVTAATQLDELYKQLRADLGLSGEPAHLTVEVEPVVLESLGYLHFRDGRLTVPSPLLLHAPVNVSDDALLVQSIAYPLVMQVWAEADAASDAAPWRDGARLWWGPMTRGLQMWLGAASDAQTADWLSDAAGWLYAEAPALRAGRRDPTSADLYMVCRGESLGRIKVPVTVSLGALCLDPAWDTHLKYLPPAPSTLRQFLAVDEWYPRPLPASAYEGWQHSVAAATVVDYFVQAYGREHLPDLVAAFRTHDSWDTLIPAVTGVSAAEFEAGWQAFLAEEYGYEARAK